MPTPESETVKLCLFVCSQIPSKDIITAVIVPITSAVIQSVITIIGVYFAAALAYKNNNRNKQDEIKLQKTIDSADFFFSRFAANRLYLDRILGSIENLRIYPEGVEHIKQELDKIDTSDFDKVFFHLRYVPRDSRDKIMFIDHITDYMILLANKIVFSLKFPDVFNVDELVKEYTEKHKEISDEINSFNSDATNEWGIPKPVYKHRK